MTQINNTCHLNLAVQYDPSITEDFLAVGLATFVKSQYLVYNFHTDREQLGFGGFMSGGDQYEDNIDPFDDGGDKHRKHKRIPAWAVVLLVLVVLAIIGAITFLYCEFKKRKIENELLQYEEREKLTSQ